MKKDIHIGKLIKRRMLELGMSVSDFAVAVNRTRATVYDIFERKSIDVELLVTISDILQFDFLSIYSNHGVPSEPGLKGGGEKYIVVKMVDKQELDNETDVLFHYRIGV